MSVAPPKTLRYCHGCEYVTVFKYKPTIGHSCCSVCGQRFGIHIDTYYDIVSLMLKHLKQELKPGQKNISLTELEKIFEKIKKRDKTMVSKMEGD